MKKITLLLSVLLCSASGHAAIYCQSELKNQSIKDSIKVRQNCSLENLIIHGDIILENDAQVTLKNNHIKGNITSNAKFKALAASDNIIKGNINIRHGQNIDLKTNDIQGDIFLQHNTGVIKLYNNEITGDLVCNSNAFTINGSKNSVTGDKKQQCQTF